MPRQIDRPQDSAASDTDTNVPWTPLRPITSTTGTQERVYVNELYRVTQIGVAFSLISYERTDGLAIRDWRHEQRMKNQLAGEEAWAVMVYPPESDRIDADNRFHLFSYPAGTYSQQPGGPGFHEARTVSGPEEARAIGAVQRPFLPDGAPGSALAEHEPQEPAEAWRPLYRAAVTRSRLTAETAPVPDGYEIYGNDLYTVTVLPLGPVGGKVLSYHRHDRRCGPDWRHEQLIKNQVAGEEAWGVSIYPPESRLLDTANEFWIFCQPAGTFRLPGVPGFHQGREVATAPVHAESLRRQRPFAPGTLTGQESGPEE